MEKYVPNIGRAFDSNYFLAVSPYRFCAQVHFLTHPPIFLRVGHSIFLSLSFQHDWYLATPCFPSLLQLNIDRCIRAHGIWTLPEGDIMNQGIEPFVIENNFFNSLGRFGSLRQVGFAIFGSCQWSMWTLAIYPLVFSYHMMHHTKPHALQLEKKNPGMLKSHNLVFSRIKSTCYL